MRVRLFKLEGFITLLAFETDFMQRVHYESVHFNRTVFLSAVRALFTFG